ncbi:flagellar biosynthetic protein FliR [Anaerosinus massiliensis]|uniref:flagellar biosynthetic protein FliR n=1 Tax=Massilibacillus massiliensis TaxID=1806837 RepID=UPI000ADD04DF|nr:flagellar biosynthetic protein FliR [Massilibacillus massiliensis]
MDILNVLENQLGLFLLVLTRISGIFIISPFLGSANIPGVIRISASVAISFVLFPLVSLQNGMVIPETLIGYIIVICTELFIGWMIGFIASLVFHGIRMAGQILDMQVGFAMVNVLDPTTGQQIPLIGSFKYNLAIIIFLVTNSHHLLLTGLFDSFQLVPILSNPFAPSITKLVIDMVAATFTIAIKISLPVLVAIILTDVALGILARTMPQMNIFVVGIPAKIFIGLFVLAFALPFYILFLDVAFNEMYGNIYIILRAMG